MAPSPTSTPFGRYQLQRRLAMGGMAEVYLAELATAAGLRKQLVIKKILRHYADDPDFREMFIGEARIAVGLSHGNIAQVFDFGEVDGEYFLALEYVSGRSVADLYKRAADRGLQVPVEFAVFIALQMCQGLHYAHTRVDDQRRPLQLVHRDISPQNVLVSYEGQVKIVDFGIAKAYGEQALDSRNNTASGVVKGKYLYFSPEQAAAKPCDALTDVYATGVVLYEMLCGRRPFEGQMFAVLGRLLSGDFPRPRSLRPEMPEALEALVLQAMATAKEDRFSSALDMQEALASFLAEHAPRLSQASLTNLMRLLFRDELQATGEDAQVPASFAVQAKAWAPTEPRSGAAVVGGRTERSPAEPSAAPTARPPWLALGLGVGALGLVAAGVLFAFSRPRHPAQMEAMSVVVPAHVATPAPARVATPPVPTAAVALAAPTPLPDQLAALAVLPRAEHGGRVVPGLRCDEQPARAEVKAVADRAAGSAHLTDAMVLLNEAIGAEPTAGKLYLTLADDATNSMNPTHPDLLLRDLETFRAACPSTSRPLLDSAYERLSGLVDPVPPEGLQDTAGDVDAASHRKATRLRADAENLMRHGFYDQALVKLHAAMEFDPNDPKTKKLMDVCLASSGGEVTPTRPTGGFEAMSRGKGRK